MHIYKYTYIYSYIYIHIYIYIYIYILICLEQDIIQFRKKAAFTPVSEDFRSTRDKVLWNAERNLVKLLLLESDIVIGKINMDIQQHLHDEYPNNVYEKRLQVEKKQLNTLKKT